MTTNDLGGNQKTGKGGDCSQALAQVLVPYAGALGKPLDEIDDASRLRELVGMLWDLLDELEFAETRDARGAGDDGAFRRVFRAVHPRRYGWLFRAPDIGALMVRPGAGVMTSRVNGPMDRRRRQNQLLKESREAGL